MLNHCEYKTQKLSLKIDPNPFISNEEIHLLMHICSIKKGNVLEIGTNKGITTGNLARAKEKQGRLISIDVTEVPTTIADGQNAGECLPTDKIGSEIPEEYKDYIEIKLINPNQDNSLANLLAELNINFDIIFIDGDHSYKGVSIDYCSVLPYLTKTGIILFHDVWWDITPPLVKGPIELLDEINGFIINKTHLGIPKEHMQHLIDTQPSLP